MKEKKSLLVLVMIFFTYQFVYGKTIGTGGTRQGGIINIMPGARASGLGNAYGSVGEDVLSMYYNPAGIGMVPFKEISISYLKLVEDIVYYNASYNQPLGIINLAVSFGFLSYGEFQEISNYENVGGNISSSEFLSILGASIKLSEYFWAGINIKYLRQSILNESGSGLSFDFGVLYSFKFLDITSYQRENIKIGVSIQNFGGNIKLKNSEAKFPSNIKLSIAYKPIHYLLFALDKNVTFNESGYWNVGLEILPNFYVSPRLGYIIGLSGKEGIVFGLGSNLRKDPILGRIDYSLLPNEDSGLKHNITLTFNFGTYKTKEEIESKQLVKEYKEKKFQEKRRREELKKQRALEELRKKEETEKQMLFKEQRKAEDVKALEGAITLAIIELEAKGVSIADANGATEFLRTAFVNTKKIRVLDRANMNTILQEQQFQQTGCTSQECIVQMGQLLSVKLVVGGTFGKLMGEYYISAHIIDVETGQILFSISETCETMNIFKEAITKLASVAAEKIVK